MKISRLSLALGLAGLLATGCDSHVRVEGGIPDVVENNTIDENLSEELGIDNGDIDDNTSDETDDATDELEHFMEVSNIDPEDSEVFGDLVSTQEEDVGTTDINEPVTIDVAERKVASKRGYTEVMAPRNDLHGSLAGRVFFVQSQSVAADKNDKLILPDIVSERDVLFVFEPKNHTDTTYRLVINRNGGEVYSKEMKPPEQIPASNQPTGTKSEIDLGFSTKGWHAHIPWRFVSKGIEIVVESSDGIFGTISQERLTFGAPIEFYATSIRIGLLTDYDPVPTYFETTPSAAAQFFATAPFSKVTISHYEPIKLKPVVLPNGTIYNSASTDTGTMHFGDMRNQVGKMLISQGINQANYGRNDSYKAKWERDNTQYHSFLRFTAHRSKGLYENGIANHGFSGGNGMGTLFKFEGNEWSHELGHSLGMGHYAGGKLSVHGPHTGWGYSGFHDRFVSNLMFDRNTDSYYKDLFSQKPLFDTFSYNRDAMGGGSHQNIVNYTLYTGYTARAIQTKNGGHYTIDRGVDGPAVHRWDAEQQKMVATTDIPTPLSTDTPVTTLVGYYDPLGELKAHISPALHGNRGNIYRQEATNGGWCRLEATATNGAVRTFSLSPKRSVSSQMNYFHVNLDGRLTWNKAEVYCGVSPTLLAKRMGVSKVNTEWKQDDSSAKAGGIYLTNDGVDAQVYRLKNSGSYWYFPSTKGADNQWWEYVGSAREITSDHFLKCIDEETVIADYFGVAKISEYWKADDPAAGVGNVTYADIEGKRHYFRQKRADTRYLPTAANDTQWWEYLGERNQLYRGLCNNGKSGKLVASKALQGPKGPLPPSIKVGREAGFSDVYDNLPDFEDSGIITAARVPLSYQGIRDFEDSLIQVYGKIVSGNAYGLVVYNVDSDRQYSIRNSSGTRSLVSLSEVRETRPNLLIYASTDPGKQFQTIDQAVANYHGRGVMKELGQSVIAGDTMKVVRNGDAHYYLSMVTWPMVNAVGYNDKNWVYIGRASEMSISDFQATPQSLDIGQIDQAVLDWAGQTEFGTWSKTDSTTPAGTVFQYTAKGYHSYYMTRLNNGNYHYFPTKQDSNSKWTLLGRVPTSW